MRTTGGGHETVGQPPPLLFDPPPPRLHPVTYRHSRQARVDDGFGGRSASLSTYTRTLRGAAAARAPRGQQVVTHKTLGGHASSGK